MNANKDEAIRAKGIAEDMMKKKDFSGARRVALKAQKLDGTLENISQMIMVCDVHCAATVMSYGNEMDWYGILQVEQTANDSIIKKQYRKLALLLHPDKNKLPGAEAAFKLIGEAQRILLDREKRSIHDMKRKASTSRPVPATSYRPQHVPTYYYTHPSAQARSAASSCQTSFWTSCAFCRTRYEYRREFLNSWVSCQQCNKRFTAYEEAAPTTKNFGQATFSFSQQKKFPGQNACNLGGKYPGNSASYFSTTKSKGQATHFPQQQPVPNQNACNVEQKCPQSSTSHYPRKESSPVSGHTAKVDTENVGGKRKRKKIVDSSESSASESSNESVEDVTIDENGDIKAGQGFGPAGGQQPRRSVRSKRQVSYKEILSDDDEFADDDRNGPVEDGDGDAERGEELEIGKKSHEDDHSKETLSNGVSREKKTNGREKDQFGASMRDSQVPDVKENSEFPGSKKDSSLGGAAEPTFYECADPDFNDFDKLREKGEFMTGQIWAIYDTADGMPRFYAEIIKVFSPGFKLRIAWLEPDPDDEEEILWCERELPVSVGKYRLGKPQITRDHLMFSHVIHCEEETQTGAYRVFPRKGETWALFKNWDINWSFDPDSHREYEYEFVETLSEYSEETGISVAYLHKVKGFSSVFCRMVKDETGRFQIPSHELYRFSHSVPSFKLTGNEGTGIPEGSHELDPASLPQKIEEITLSSTANDCGSPVSIFEGIITPEPQFHNFDDDKSEEKFQTGQIWSLYTDEDGLPKHYARIQKVERKPSFKLHVSWLELKSLPENVTKWIDKEMPISCGTFSVAKGGQDIYTCVTQFSHQITPRSSKKRNEYTIFPEKGDVWAIYKNWSNEIKIKDLKDWEYDVMEVVDGNETGFEVLLLEKVDGFSSVFKKATKQGCEGRMMIPQAELLRFSHRVPWWRLKEEREGILRGCFELDAGALSRNFFRS